MDLGLLDQYFELALDLPERKRRKLLSQLEHEDPAMATKLRELLENPRANGDFACSSAVAPTMDTLHHVAVQVADIPKAVDWYRTHFGCAVEHQDETWALLRFANVHLALVMPSQHPPHFAVTRSDAERFGPLNQHRDGTRSAYIVDPWQNSVEVLDRASLPGEEEEQKE